MNQAYNHWEDIPRIDQQVLLLWFLTHYEDNIVGSIKNDFVIEPSSIPTSIRQVLIDTIVDTYDNGDGRESLFIEDYILPGRGSRTTDIHITLKDTTRELVDVLYINKIETDCDGFLKRVKNWSQVDRYRRMTDQQFIATNILEIVYLAIFHKVQLLFVQDMLLFIPRDTVFKPALFFHMNTLTYDDKSYVFQTRTTLLIKVLMEGMQERKTDDPSESIYNIYELQSRVTGKSKPKVSIYHNPPKVDESVSKLIKRFDKTLEKEFGKNPMGFWIKVYSQYVHINFTIDKGTTRELSYFCP